jgi:hypothetical protein
VIKKIYTSALIIVVACAFTERAFSQMNITASGDLQLVKAKVADLSGKAAPGVMTYMAIAAPVVELRTAISDEEGNVQFLIPNLPSKGQLILQADNRKDSNLVFTVEKDYLNAFGTEEQPVWNYDIGDTTFFYGVPDKSYELDNYTRFASLEEVFREYVTEVKIGKQGENFSLNVLNKPFKIFFNNEPLVLLDGVPIFNYNRLLEIDPLKIRRIDVVARKYYLGSLLCNGIINLFSFDGDLAGYSLPYRALVSEFDRDKR